jgi:folate-binding protein YgfZ
MLDGMITNRVPAAPSARGSEVFAGRASYAAMLTAKGKMVTDLRVLFKGAKAEEGLLLDLPVAGRSGALSHFSRYLPPRLARAEEVSAMGMLTLVGPDSPELVSRIALGLRVGPEELDEMEADSYVNVGSQPARGVLVLRCGDLGLPAYDIMADMRWIAAMWSHFREAEVAPVGHGVWETLRIEAGSPEFGQDMDETTIPYEAGIDGRAVDHQKGCYTGQEVIVRIRDRGKVNWHLRGLLLGEIPAPGPGTQLFRAEADQPMGRVTSEAQSPRLGQSIALGYVRREVDPPAELRLGVGDGPLVGVRAVGPDGWELEEGDVHGEEVSSS